MNTLYDLLGALPNDDAEGLRSAFRKAVKGAHPDLRPGDPDAALKFREIIRANEILGDPEQRAAYDHLLGLAHQEQVSVSKQAVFVRVHRFASGVMAFAGISIATVGGYLLFMHMSAASVAPLDDDAAMRESLQAGDGASPIQQESPNIAAEAAAANVPTPQSKADSIPPANTGPALDPAAAEARSLRTRGMSAFRHGDLHSALADLDRALQLDPKFLPAYIDRATILYRVRKVGHAFADLAGAKRIEEADRAKSASVSAGKAHSDQAETTASVTALSQRRKAVQKTPKEEAFTPLWTR